MFSFFKLLYQIKIEFWKNTTKLRDGWMDGWDYFCILKIFHLPLVNCQWVYNFKEILYLKKVHESAVKFEYRYRPMVRVRNSAACRKGKDSVTIQASWLPLPMCLLTWASWTHTTDPEAVRLVTNSLPTSPLSHWDLSWSQVYSRCVKTSTVQPKQH